MLKIEELNDIYDQGIDNNDQGPGPKAVKFKDFQQAIRKDPTKGAITYGQAKGIDIEPYKGYNTEGVYANRDINAIRGENQSVSDKWGNWLAKTVS